MSTTAERFPPIFTPYFMAVFFPRSFCPLCLMRVNSASLLCCWPIYLLEPDCYSLSMTIGLFYHIWYLIFSALDLSLTALPSSFFPWCSSWVCVMLWTLCLSLYVSQWHGCHLLLNPFILWGLFQHAWCELTHVSPSLIVIIDDLIFSYSELLHSSFNYPPESLSACLFGENCCTVSPGFWHNFWNKSCINLCNQHLHHGVVSMYHLWGREKGCKEGRRRKIWAVRRAGVIRRAVSSKAFGTNSRSPDRALEVVPPLSAWTDGFGIRWSRVGHNRQGVHEHQQDGSTKREQMQIVLCRSA